MTASQSIQPTLQSQVATKGQQQQSRGQPISFLVIDDQQAEPSRPLTFTLTSKKHFNPPSVASATSEENNTTYQDSQASLEIYRGLLIWFEKVLKFAGNGLDFVWKFVGNLCNTSLNKSSWNNWVVLKRTDSSPEKD